MTASDIATARSVMETAVGRDRLREDVASYSVDGVVPAAVAVAHAVHDVERVMTAAWRHGLAVAPWGGGTRNQIGNIPERVDVVLDLSRLDRVVAHNPDDLTATVEAGIKLDTLQRTLAERGQLLAVDPPLPDRATVGGTLATAASGPLRWQYGHVRDLVIGLKVVQADGTSTKSGGQVVKNVSGYDMARLHIGALGTLGVITEVSLKLTPLPRRQATVLAAFDSFGPAAEAALSVFHSHVPPLAVTLFGPQAVLRLGLNGADGKALLAVRVGGRTRTLERQVRECHALSKGSGAVSIETIDGAEAEALWRAAADFGWDDRAGLPIQASASVLPTAVLATVEAIERGSDGAALKPAVIAHPAYGKVHVCWSVEDDSALDGETVRVLCDTRDAVRRLGGSLLVERCPPHVKRRLDVWGDVGDSLAVMRSMKRQYDPKRVLNPGRFVGGI